MKRVYLEITDACNLRCPFCTYEKGNSFMSLDQIDDYTSQIKPYCNYIYLHILGEPLLHPDFEKILDILDQKGFQLQLVTNGTLLNRFLTLDEHPCLRKLSISLHSYDHCKEKDHYFEMIDALITKDHPFNIELRFYNEESLSEDLKDYKNKLIKQFGIEETKRSSSYLLKKNVYLYEEDFFRWPDISDPYISDTGTCHGGIDMIAINHEGKVGLCCLDPKAHTMIGDLKKESLAAILDSKIYKDYTEGFRQRKILPELCKRCSYRLRFRS